MSYSTETEVREMLKDDALNAIIGDAYIEDAAERETKIAPIIAAAVEDADGEIDGYLAKRYPTPLEPTPKIINKLSKDSRSPRTSASPGPSRRPSGPGISDPASLCPE